MGEGGFKALGADTFRFQQSSPSTEGKRETYDKAYWTPERIGRSIVSFFEKLDRNETRLKAERQKLFEQAVKSETERKRAEHEIAGKEMGEAEQERRTRFEQELRETEAQRQFRLTLEWMIEKGSEQVQELAIQFLNPQQSPSD